MLVNVREAVCRKLDYMLEISTVCIVSEVRDHPFSSSVFIPEKLLNFRSELNTEDAAF